MKIRGTILVGRIKKDTFRNAIKSYIEQRVVSGLSFGYTVGAKREPSHRITGFKEMAHGFEIEAEVLDTESGNQLMHCITGRRLTTLGFVASSFKGQLVSLDVSDVWIEELK